MLSGGVADKTGNRFEARWLTRQLLGLIDGKAQSITVEKVGDDEEGFEFLVERRDASEWHQCKRQTSDTSWTITALARESIIGNFAAKLALSATHHCVFTSTDVVKQIKLLKEKRVVVETVGEFENILSQDETKHWQSLRTQLATDGKGALEWLSRCDFINISEEMLEEIIASEIAYWFKGDPDKIVSAIRSWVEKDSTFNKPIDRATFLAFVQTKGFLLKQYEADQTLPGRIERATASYQASYGAVGADLFAIPRPETDRLVEALLGDPPVKIVALVGPAGSGKSVIIRDAIARIAGSQHTQLAFRVDQIGEPLSLAQLGEVVIEVEDSPAVVLERLSGDRPAILYIDQADTVSQMSGRSAHVRRQVVDLVNQAQRYQNIRLVFSCRTFDIENDQLFTEIAKREETLRIDVPALDWNRDVVPVLRTFEILINVDNPRIQALLTQPIGLSIAGRLSQTGVKDLRNVENLSQLFDMLLSDRDRALRERHKPPWSVYSVLETIAEEMSRRQELVAPVRLLDPFAGARDHLQQEGLIVVTGQKVSLLHESLFDYLHARVFVGSGKSLLEFLTSSEQTLFRRTQVRQILAAERDLDYKRYLTDLEAVLTSDKVRPHVRDLVLRWLGTVPEPAADEWKILATHSEQQGDDEVPRSIGSVIFGQPGWFTMLADAGVVRQWLEGSAEAQGWALNYLRSVSDGGGTKLPAILNTYLDDNPDKAGLVLEHLHWLSPKEPAPELGDVLIRALGMIDDAALLSAGDALLELYGSWIQNAPADAARILRATLDTWFRLTPKETPFQREFENGGGAFHHVVELSKAHPIKLLEAILPAMAEAMRRRLGEDGPPHQDQIWDRRQCNSDAETSEDLLGVVRAAFAHVAAEEPDEVDRLVSILNPANQITGLHLLLEAIASNGEALAPLLVVHRDHPALFAAGWDGAPAHSASKAVAAAWDWLTPRDKALFEGRILALWPEFDDVKWALSLRRAEKAPFKRTPEDIRGMALEILGSSGLRQWSVLGTIGEARLSPIARDRFRFLSRKFAEKPPETPWGVRGGHVQSPIAADRAAHMSDASWLAAFAKIRDSGRFEWRSYGVRGGATELAHVLQARVKEDPDRFLNLLQHVPHDAIPTFANAIVMGISEGGATSERTERLFELLDKGLIPHPGDATPLIWLVRATKGNKGPLTVDFMLKVATSGDAKSGIADRVNDNAEKPEPDFKRAVNLGRFLDTRAMNSAQGSAMQEIGAQSWENEEKFKKYSPIVEPFVGSNMPDFMHASLSAMLLAALKHDVAIASDWIKKTANACPTALYTRNGRQALLWLDSRVPDVAGPILNGLSQSSDPLTRAIGSLLIAQRSLEDERWKPVSDKLIEAGTTQRAAIAEVAASSVSIAEHVGRATAWLTRLFDDDDEGVRTTAIGSFRRLNPENMATHVPLYEAYVSSKFFNADRTYFLQRLEKASAAMGDIVLGLIEKTVEIAKGRSSNSRTGLYQIWDPLLRIYTSCGDSELRIKRCLDVIDELVKLDAVGSSKLNTLT